jgi:DNA-binding NtrC family response regulator
MVASAFVTDDVECAFETGAVTFLRKPYTQEALLKAIARAVARDARYQAKYAANEDVLRRVATFTSSLGEAMFPSSMRIPSQTVGHRRTAMPDFER